MASKKAQQTEKATKTAEGRKAAKAELEAAASLPTPDTETFGDGTEPGNGAVDESEIAVTVSETEAEAAPTPTIKRKPQTPTTLNHETPHDTPDHIQGLRFYDDGRPSPDTASKPAVVGEMHRTKSRSTGSLIIAVKTMEEPRWLDETRGGYATICASHGYIRYYESRSKAFEDWTRPMATGCPFCEHYARNGERLEGDVLGEVNAEPEPAGEPDSEVVMPPSPVSDSAEVGEPEGQAEPEGAENEAEALPV